MSVATLTDSETIESLAGRLAGAPFIGLDTEFMRERTYRPQLCLVQVAVPGESQCIDPLAGADLGSLTGVMRDASIPKILHAARQDLEVLWPVFGSVSPVFDTQIAAALTGLPAQIGYSDLVRRLLGIDLPKGQTRTDWSRRPLSEAQLVYAIDDVVHLGALRDLLSESLRKLDRLAWLDEELEGLASPDKLFVDPEKAHQRLRWTAELDADRARLAQRLAAWRERRASEKDRPRSWILDDAGLRNIVMRVPRTLAELGRIEDLAPGFVERSGPALLEVIESAALPTALSPLPQRARPDPEKTALVKRLGARVQEVATGLSLSPEILTTRRELEMLAHGSLEGDVLRGWRRAVIGEELLELALN